MDKDIYLSHLEKLENAIWTTRKNRINAEERLLSINRFVQHINIYYACLSAAIAIVSLWYTDKALTMLGAILAPIVTICVIFSNSQRYEQRAADIKRNYIKLQKILYQVQRLELADAIDPTQLESLENGYCELMSEVENHHQCDYWKTVYQSGFAGKNDAPPKFEKWKYFLYRGICCLLCVSAYVAPFLGYFVINAILTDFIK